MASKRKRVDLDLNAKTKILQDIDNNVKQKDIASQFGIDVSTVSKLVKNREKVEKDFHSSLTSSGCKRMCSSAYGYHEDGLLQWFKQTRSALMPVSGPMLAEVAERLAKEMNMPDWKCSNSFLERFKKRHSITFKVAAGEAASVEAAAVTDWVAQYKIFSSNSNSTFWLDLWQLLLMSTPFNITQFWQSPRCDIKRV